MKIGMKKHKKLQVVANSYHKKNCFDIIYLDFKIKIFQIKEFGKQNS